MDGIAYHFTAKNALDCAYTESVFSKGYTPGPPQWERAVAADVSADVNLGAGVSALAQLMYDVLVWLTG